MISVTILTKNSARTLPPTLAALKNFPEVLVLDTGSTDTTLEIAKAFPNVTIHQAPFQGFGPTHNLASSLARYDWILSIDSDEVVSEPLSAEILSLSLNPRHVYSVDRHNYFNGKRIRCCSGWYPDRIIRLYHRNTTHFSSDAVHEKILHDSLDIIPLKGALFHTPYESIDHFIHKMQLYSTLFAEQNKGKKKASLKTALGHALVAFFKNYFLKRGFLGGKEGLIISLHNSLTTYYKYAKLVFLNEKAFQKQDLEKFLKDKEAPHFSRQSDTAFACKESKKRAIEDGSG